VNDDWRTMAVVASEVRAAEEALLEAMGTGECARWITYWPSTTSTRDPAAR